MHQGQVAEVCLLKSDQDLAEPVHPGMAGFHHPTASTAARGRGFVLALLTSGAHMRCVASVRHGVAGVATVEPLVRAKVVRPFLGRFRSFRDNGVEDQLKLADIMTVGSGGHDGERGTAAVGEHMTLGPHFFPGPSGSDRRTLWPRAPWSSLRQCSATPTVCLSTHRSRIAQPSRALGKNLPGPISESDGGQRCRFRTAPLEELSTDIRSEGRRRYLRTPSGQVKAFSRHPLGVCTSCSGLSDDEERAAPQAPTADQRLSRTGVFPLPISASEESYAEVASQRRRQMSSSIANAGLASNPAGGATH